MRRLILLVVVLFRLRADEIDRAVAEEMQNQHIPGLSVGVMRDGRLIKARGYGFANLELSVPATSDTVYAIGSVSKEFIAAGILLLAQDGRLSVDDKVSKYLTDAPASWSGITIRHLLTHTSGLVREGPAFQATKTLPDIDVIRSAYPVPLEFEPGAKWQYCNLGYFTLAEIIHRVADKPWADFLDERIFRPLEMQVTRTASRVEVVPLRASSYQWQSGKFVNAPPVLTVRPSGALLSNVIDLAKWDTALYTDKLFTNETKQKAWTPVRLNDGSTYEYGFGWNLKPYKGHRTVNHGGSMEGFKTHFLRLPDDRLSVVVFTNAGQANPTPIAEKIADAYLAAR
jgi:CubicO group peptidase (beta-lactamase class C family)